MAFCAQLARTQLQRPVHVSDTGQGPAQPVEPGRVLLWGVQALRGGGTVGDSPPMDPVTEGVVRAAETRENTLVLLPDAIPCTVSFTRGSEKPVLLGVHGLPQVGARLEFRGLAVLGRKGKAMVPRLCVCASGCIRLEGSLV